MGDLDFLVARRVVEVRVGATLRIVFELGERVEPALYCDLEEVFTYVDREGVAHTTSRADPSALGPLLEIVGGTVTKAAAVDAVLALTFDDGSSIRCEPHATFEAWQVVGGTPQYLVVCGQGELAVWEEPGR